MSAAMSRIRARVAAPTSSRPESAREAVALPTPAARATSDSDTRFTMTVTPSSNGQSMTHTEPRGLPMPTGRARYASPTHSLDRGKQLGNAPLHEFSHHQRCPRAFDTVDVEDLPC